MGSPMYTITSRSVALHSSIRVLVKVPTAEEPKLMRVCLKYIPVLSALTPYAVGAEVDGAHAAAGALRGCVQLRSDVGE